MKMQLCRGDGTLWLFSGKPHSQWVDEDGRSWILHRQVCLPARKPLRRPNVLAPALWPADIGEWDACIIVHDLHLLRIGADPIQKVCISVDPIPKVTRLPARCVCISVDPTQKATRLPARCVCISVDPTRKVSQLPGRCGQAGPKNQRILTVQQARAFV